MCSVAGGMASQLVDREIPSQLRRISPAGYDRGETVSGGDLLDDVD